MTRTCPKCGAVYEDVDQLTVCPHIKFAGRKAEVRRMIDELGAVIAGDFTEGPPADR